MLSKNGPLFTALNVLRALSIVALLLVLSSNIVTIASDSRAIKAARHGTTTTTLAAPATATVTSTAVVAATSTRIIDIVPSTAPTGGAPVLNARADAECAAGTDDADADYQEPPEWEEDDDDDEWAEIESVDGDRSPLPDGWVYVDGPAEDSNDASQSAAAEDKTATTAAAQDDTPPDYYQALAAVVPAAAVPAANSTASNVTVNDSCSYIPGSTVPLQAAGAFWSILNRIFIIFEAILLVLAEIGYPARLFTDYLPMLGPSFGLGTLGALQGLIASSVLSHHSNLFPQVSAWLLFVVGCANVLVGIFLRGGQAKTVRSLFRWEAAEGGGRGEQHPQAKPVAAVNVAYDWHSHYKEKKKKAGDTDTGIGTGTGTSTRGNSRSAPPRPPSSAGSIYSSTVVSHGTGGGASVQPPTVVPGARFGGFSFGRQAERAGARPPISRPQDGRSLV